MTMKLIVGVGLGEGLFSMGVGINFCASECE